MYIYPVQKVRKAAAAKPSWLGAFEHNDICYQDMDSCDLSKLDTSLFSKQDKLWEMLSSLNLCNAAHPQNYHFLTRNKFGC